MSVKIVVLDNSINTPLLLALASEVFAPHIPEGSPLAMLLAQHDAKRNLAQSAADQPDMAT